MAGEPIAAWDQRLLVGNETTFGTPDAPAAGQTFEAISIDMGPAQQAETRSKKDRTQGRGMTTGFVEGRVKPIPFSIQTTVKSRASATTVAKESAIYKSAGMIETVGGSNVTYTFTSAPDVPGLQIYRILGTGTSAYFAEQGRGGLVSTLTWSGGDQELTVDAKGAFIGKYHQGRVDSITVNDAVTSYTFTGEDVHRVNIGYYLCESEIILVTAMNYTTGVATITRGALSSSAVAHTAKPLTPYIGTLTYSGNPLTEANATVSYGGSALRCTKFQVELSTGIEHLPGETGSAYSQGFKSTRYDLKTSFTTVMKREEVNFIGRTLNRTNGAITITCGTGAGSIATFSMPYGEFEPSALPDNQNDVVSVDWNFRHRDSSGNDMFTLTMS